MVDRATPHDLRSDPRSGNPTKTHDPRSTDPLAAPRAGTHLHRHPRGHAARGLDPVRRRAGAAGGAGPAAQAPRPGRLGDGPPRPRRARRCGGGCSPAPSRPRRGPRRALPAEIEELMRAGPAPGPLLRQQGRSGDRRLCQSRGGDRRKARSPRSSMPSEAAEDGRRKLAASCENGAATTISALPVVVDFSSDELDLALGRSHVIHAALVAGAGSDGFLTLWHRYRSYRGIEAEPVSPPRDEVGDPIGIEPAGSERND